MDPEILVGIVVFLILFMLLVVAFIGWGIGTPLVPEMKPIIRTGGLLSACTSEPCSSGTVCDGTSFICKLPLGSPCSSFSDCGTGLICSGLCSTGATGNLDNLCPCNRNFVCTKQPNSLSLCKGRGGTQCSKNGDCSSSFCENGRCSVGAPDSHPCVSHSECASNNCSFGFCQEQGTITGILGSSCAGTCVGFTGAECKGTTLHPLSCQCVQGEGNPGTCVASNQGISSPCSGVKPCSNQLFCYNPRAGKCGGETGCACSFLYEDSNASSPETVCIGGMSSISGISECFNNTGLGCDVGGMCSTGDCAGGSVLMTYRFSLPNVPNLRTSYINATTTVAVPIPASPGVIQPHKMFLPTSTPGSGVDKIFLSDNIQGLLLLSLDTIDLAGNWTVLIPHLQQTTGGTRTLLDAAVNGNNFLVAFHETSGEKQNDTLYIGATLTELSPFNPQGSGIPGTQYDEEGMPLPIEFVDLSTLGEVLISSGGTVYTKRGTRYEVGTIQGGPMSGQPMKGVTGPPRFYEGTGTTSIAFVKEFREEKIYDQVLQFSGSLAGLAIPTDKFGDIQYKVFDFDINSGTLGTNSGGSTIVLTSAYKSSTFIGNMVAVNFGGTTSILPYRISNTSRCAVSSNAFYVLSIGSCK